MFPSSKKFHPNVKVQLADSVQKEIKILILVQKLPLFESLLKMQIDFQISGILFCPLFFALGQLL